MTLSLSLDHVSVVVPALEQAVDHLERRLGLRTTVSTADPTRHGRVHLDRSYLEISAHPGHSGWRASLFFLRFEDPRALRVHLDALGLTYRFGEYVGVDGRWDDVEVLAGTTPMPILVRRTDPPDVASNWPPPLTKPHRSSARKLAAVWIAVADLEAAAADYRLLLGPSIAGAAAGRRSLRFPLAAGELVLVEGEPVGIMGIVLGVESLGDAAAVVGEPLDRIPGDEVAWLNSTVTFGMPTGFVEEPRVRPARR